MHRILTAHEAGGIVVWSAEGELDAYTAPDLETSFDEARRGDALVADLSEVSFMDSTALGLVVRVVRELSEDGGLVRVVLPRTTARRIFELTTLDSILPLSGSRADAVEELRALAATDGA